MTDTMLETYLAGWANICSSTPESIEQMTSGAHPDIRFSDVNVDHVTEGHDGLRRISKVATDKYSGTVFKWDRLIQNGNNWSVRWTIAGKGPDGSTFSARGASAGTLADDGRVIEHTDYWSRPGAYA